MDDQGTILGAWIVMICVVAAIVLVLLAMTGCSPEVHGGWLVLHQTVIPCPSPVPTPL